MYFYQSPIGKLWFVEKQGKIVSAVFGNDNQEGQEISADIKKALDNYFNHKIDLPNNLFQFPDNFTNFQQKVFQEIIKVPFGKTITYQQIAKNIGSSMAYRAVAGACAKNPLALFIPCHRVVRSQNEDFGYSWGRERKEWLLGFESN